MKTKTMLVAVAAALAVACLMETSAKADPQLLQSLPVTGIAQTTADNITYTNLGLTYKILPNAQMILQYSYTVTGTNNSAGTIAFAHNYTVGDGNWTTQAPITNTLTMGAVQTGPNASVGVAQFIMNWTNFTGEAQGRLDDIVIKGATNVTINAISISQKTITPY